MSKKTKRRLTTLLLAASLIWTGSWGADHPPESTEIPQPVECGRDIRLAPGVHYAFAEHQKLIDILRERRQRAEKAEAELTVLRAEIAILKHQKHILELRVEEAQIEGQIYKIRAGSWLRRHFGPCLGLGASAVITGETEGDVNLSAFGGFCFKP